MTLFANNTWRQIRSLQSLLQPRNMLVLLTLWFTAGFAPLVCIIHCQFLHRSHAAHLHMHHTSAAASTASQPVLCSTILHQPSDAPGLPPESTLPRIMYDMLPTVFAVAAPALLVLALVTFRTILCCPRQHKPPTPPPRILCV